MSFSIDASVGLGSPSNRPQNGGFIHMGSPLLTPFRQPLSPLDDASSAQYHPQMQNMMDGGTPTSAGTNGMPKRPSVSNVPPPPPPPKDKKPDYYAVLGVTKDHSEAEMKKAYLKLSLKMHPDKNPNDPKAQDNFALLNEAWQTLSDPIKRIDYNREMEGRDSGWGWDQEAAKKRAQEYKWNGEDMIFSMGARMSGKGGADGEMDGMLGEKLQAAAVFWLCVIALAALIDVLVVVTGLNLGMPTAAGIWAGVIAALSLMGMLVSYRYPDWQFPGGNLVAIAGLIALLTGLPGGDLAVQGFAYSGSHNWQVVSSIAEAGGDFAVYRFASGGYVDLTGLVRAGDWCAAPLTAQSGQVANAAEAKFWALSSNCCPVGSTPSCAGWGGMVNEGINWGWGNRPKMLFLKGDGALSALANSGVGASTKFVEVSFDGAKNRISALFSNIGWIILAVPLVCWPILLSCIWFLLSFGSCLALDKLRCGQDALEWPLYLCGGLPMCCSDLGP